MHPISFVAWMWEKAWSQDGLLPLLEHNQGSLSLAALVFALAAFLVENRRANQAKAEAIEAERQRLEAAQTAEADRRTYEFEIQRHEAEARRVAEIDRQLQRMAKFVRTANGIVLKVERAINDDMNAAQASAAQGATSTLFPSMDARKTASVAAESLIAILPAAPMEPDLITDVRRIAHELEWWGGPSHGVYQSEAAVPYLREQAEKLIQSRSDLTEHNIMLTTQLRPSPPPEPNFDLTTQVPTGF